MKVIYKPNLETLEEGDTLGTGSIFPKNLPYHKHLTEGKIYTAEKIQSHNHYKMKCDDGEIRYVYIEDFTELSEYRKNQIDKIILDNLS